MDSKRFRVSASVGGSRSLPWPFGVLDVSAEQLRLHSSFRWWVKNQDFTSDNVQSIRAFKKLGTLRLVAVMNDGSELKVEFLSSGKVVIQTFESFGYTVS
jgi:hypothetical protein